MLTTTPAPDVDDLHDFLMDAATDASARAGDPFGDRTPLTTAFADAECRLIAALDFLVETDAHARAFVQRWRARVQATDDYPPQRRGVRLPPSGGVQWTIGAQRLRAAVTLFDAFVRDDVVKTYRTLGTVVEDVEESGAAGATP